MSQCNWTGWQKFGAKFHLEFVTIFPFNGAINNKELCKSTEMMTFFTVLHYEIHTTQKCTTCHTALRDVLPGRCDEAKGTNKYLLTSSLFFNTEGLCHLNINQKWYIYPFLPLKYCFYWCCVTDGRFYFWSGKYFYFVAM